MYPEVAEEKGLLQQLTDMLLEDLVTTKIDENRLPYYYDLDMAKTMLTPCQNDTANSSECSFIRLLTGISKNVMFFDRGYTSVKDYIRKSAMAKEEVTLQGLEDYMENHYGFVIGDEKQFPQSKRHYKVLLQWLVYMALSIFYIKKTS